MSDKPLIDRPAGPSYGTQNFRTLFPPFPKAFYQAAIRG